MRIEGNPIIAFALGDRQADRIVPRIGLTAWLVVFIASAMAFLAVFALALMFTTDRVATNWTAELERSATVRVTAAETDMAVATATVLRILQTTPGIEDARVLSDEEQRALLEPWLGPDLPLQRMTLPRLIEITVASDGYDAQSLRLRLEGEAPGSILDDHARWRAPLIRAAARVRLVGLASVVLIGAVMAGMVMLAARAALATNAQVIEVLRLIGARDVYVARAFVRRITLRSLAGAMIGTALGLLCVALLPPGSDAAGLLAEFGFRGSQWVWPLLLPLVSGIVAFWTSRSAAMASLRKTN